VRLLLAFLYALVGGLPLGPVLGTLVNRTEGKERQ
jgi:hypothetical protein